MGAQATKCVMVVDDSLPLGVISNIVAIMGISLGKKNLEIVGVDAPDADGRVHTGLIQFPVPVLKAPAEKLNALRAQVFEPEYAESP